MSRALTMLTTTVYALALTGGLLLGDDTQRVAALLLAAVLVARGLLQHRRTAQVAVILPVPVVAGRVSTGSTGRGSVVAPAVVGGGS